jgi:quercetin dioxygenase-like cupin family protein
MKIRRVVTGHTREGKSIVQQDGQIETLPGRPGFSQVPVWATKELPAKLTDEHPDSWKLGTTIAGGSVFRVIQYAPGVAERWHRTDSIDYAVILSGEIDMQMDEGEVRLKAGDVVVQRWTTHNWVNRGTDPCVIAFVLIATEGGQSTGW